MDAYSARELRAAAGVSAEVLDYWQRIALVAPDCSGTYSARTVSLSIVLSEAASLGAAGPALAAVAARLTGPTSKWPDTVWVTANGVVLDEDTSHAALVLHVKRCLAHAGPMLAHAMAAA